MNVIGFGGSGHDWSCCVIRDGVVVAQLDEERASRRKYGLGADLLKSQARDACLAAAGLSIDDIDHAVACDLVPITLTGPFRRRVHRINHHEAHAYGAYFASGAQAAAVLIADNSGSPAPRESFVGDVRRVETVSYWRGEARELHRLGGVFGAHHLPARTLADYHQSVGETDDSLGHLYWTTSEELGFVFRSQTPPGVLTEDGKTMGLASYGDLRFAADFQRFVEWRDGGQITVRLADGAFRSLLRTLIADAGDDEAAAFATRAAIARGVQEILEQGMLHCARHLRESSDADVLVLAGGVALNCVANGRLAREAGFERISVLPAAGDNGNALGSALYGLIALGGFQGKLEIETQLPFLGPRHPDSVVEQVVDAARQAGLSVRRPPNLHAEVAAQIAAGDIVAWFEGRSEFGPRALGHRSILADPRDYGMRERLNRVTKRRELFRPFAPIVLAEKAEAWFEVVSAERAAASYMLTAAPVRAEARTAIPAVVHVDGTARLQLVDPLRYPGLDTLLRAFEAISGVPILLNTSLNRGGEPLVESPQDALDCFLGTDLDHLALEGWLISR